MIENDKIIINKTFDKNKLNSSQQYLIDSISNGKINKINEYILEEKIKNDAKKDGLISEKNDLEKKIRKHFIISFAITCLFILLLSLSSVLSIFLFIGMIFSWLFCIFGILTEVVVFKQDPYYRTKKGNSINKELEGLKVFLKESSLNEKNREEIVLWEDYLVYSVLFNQNKKVLDQYKKMIK